MKGINKAPYRRRTVLYVVMLLLGALFVPKWGMRYFSASIHAANVSPNSKFKFGLENITDEFLHGLKLLGDGVRIGVITNQSGKDQRGRSTVDVLLEHGLNVTIILTPEHGLEGLIQYHAAHEKKDIETYKNIPVFSLYGKGNPASLGPKTLKKIDVLIFDIQELGMRHNTYLTTLFQAVEAAGKNNKTLIVLDRPNMLGSVMEGPLVDEGLQSSIAYTNIPLRHGMTIGELALYYNEYITKHKARVHVVPMADYNRYQLADFPLVDRLTPGIRTITSCQDYSILGLVGEVRPFDVGLGTERPFQYIAIADTIKFSQKNWFELHELLKENHVDAIFGRYYSARRKNYFSGLRISINDMNAFSSTKTLIAMLSFFKKSGLDIKFSKHFDSAIGTRKVREYIEGHISRQDLEAAVNRGLADFYARATKVFLYRPHPYLMKL